MALPHQTTDVKEQRDLISLRDCHNNIPITKDAKSLVNRTRNEINMLIQGKDDRLLVVVGPCSIHDVNAAKEYAERLAAIQKKLSQELVIVMRTYFEKPRTTVGWKGLINDPTLDERFDINKGLQMARRLLSDINNLGVPTATEFLSLFTPSYYSDFISWGAIGARTVVSQVHRELASSLDCPIGFKNNTDGNVKVAVEGVVAAKMQHHLFSVSDSGKTTILLTEGNPNCHIILRGGKEPNYSQEDLLMAELELVKAHLPKKLVIDFSHGNSGKDHHNQMTVACDVAKRIEQGEQRVFGVMIESHLLEGRQELEKDIPLIYGKSITDSCIGWNETVIILKMLAEAIKARRKIPNFDLPKITNVFNTSNKINLKKGNYYVQNY